MELINLKNGDIFETHSGEKFQMIIFSKKGRQKEIRKILRLKNQKFHTFEEFDNVSIFNVNKTRL
jgi:hypothetical protein